MPKEFNRFLPYSRQAVDEEDIAAVVAVLSGDWLTTGPLVSQFEAAIAKRVGASHTISCSNGTAALHLAALAFDLRDGVAVVPSVTFVATANAVLLAGGEVVFADVDSETGLMTVETLRAALDRVEPSRVRALLPVHLAGQVADPIGIQAVAAEHGMVVIEDASHALGTSYGDGQEIYQVGSCRHSDAAIFSFHPVKNVTTAEGGAICVRDPDVTARLARLRSHGIVRDPRDFIERDQAFTGDTPNPWYHEMQLLGLNYRLTDVQSALGISQLHKLDRFAGHRNRLAELYREKLQPLAPMVRPLPQVPHCNAFWHLFVVMIDFEQVGLDRVELMRRLRESGVGSQVHYIPVHRQPFYRRRYGERQLPGADAYYARCLSLPLFVGMEEDEVDRVVDALVNALA